MRLILRKLVFYHKNKTNGTAKMFYFTIPIDVQSLECYTHFTQIPNVNLSLGELRSLASGKRGHPKSFQK